LHTAARDGDIKRLKRCVEDIKWLEPVDVNAQSSQGHTPLHMSAANGHMEAMQYILSQKGVEINAQTKMGNTSLHLAAMNSRDTACRMLVNHGIGLQKANKAGKIAADLCPAQASELKKYLDIQVAKAENGDDVQEDEV